MITISFGSRRHLNPFHDPNPMKENQMRAIESNKRKPSVSQEPSSWRRLVMTMIVLTGLFGHPLLAADAAGVGEKAKEVVRETSMAMENAGTTAADSATELWQRIDEARLKNRTPDELVAWVIMGVLVGAVAGMMTSLKPTGLGQIGRLVLGLAGAFLGGIVAHVGHFDFGWGPVLIRYEELFFSLVGAILIVAAGKILRYRIKRKSPP